ncbi:hypothetical protein BG842_26300 [Haladaptatus sp. W1]|nr:hypothetical protein BG842_26300 [Haladaptatus sp. W1]
MLGRESSGATRLRPTRTGTQCGQERRRTHGDAYGVLVVSGDDRIEYVDNIVSNTVPSEDGRGTYAVLLDPQGKVELDMYVYCAGEGSTPVAKHVYETAAANGSGFKHREARRITSLSPSPLTSTSRLSKPSARHSRIRPAMSR